MDHVVVESGLRAREAMGGCVARRQWAAHCCMTGCLCRVLLLLYLFVMVCVCGLCGVCVCVCV